MREGLRKSDLVLSSQTKVLILALLFMTITGCVFGEPSLTDIENRATPNYSVAVETATVKDEGMFLYPVAVETATVKDEGMFLYPVAVETATVKDEGNLDVDEGLTMGLSQEFVVGEWGSKFNVVIDQSAEDKINDVKALGFFLDKLRGIVDFQGEAKITFFSSNISDENLKNLMANTNNGTEMNNRDFINMNPAMCWGNEWRGWNIAIRLDDFDENDEDYTLERIRFVLTEILNVQLGINGTNSSDNSSDVESSGKALSFKYGISDRINNKAKQVIEGDVLALGTLLNEVVRLKGFQDWYEKGYEHGVEVYNLAVYAFE